MTDMGFLGWLQEGRRLPTSGTRLGEAYRYVKLIISILSIGCDYGDLELLTMTVRQAGSSALQGVVERLAAQCRSFFRPPSEDAMFQTAMQRLALHEAAPAGAAGTRETRRG
jgi:hypothetical protein